MGAVGTALLAAAAALVTSLGMGGGAVLLLYLTAVKGMDQLEAQGLNLLFFMAVAVVSLCFHLKNRLVDFRRLWLVLLGGAPGVFAGVWLAEFLGGDLLRRGFALLLFVIGIKELLPTKNTDKHPE